MNNLSKLARQEISEAGCLHNEIRFFRYHTQLEHPLASQALASLVLAVRLAERHDCKLECPLLHEDDAGHVEEHQVYYSWMTTSR